jgi:serine/threonine protein kinase
MASRSDTHPPAETLSAYRLGQLDDHTTEMVSRHLQVCPACYKEVAALTSDDSAPGGIPDPGLTPAPLQSPFNATPLPGSPGPAPAVAGLPAELATSSQYEISRELGRGGMGVVYLAWNKLMARWEVLKVVNQALLSQPGALERFLREMQSAARLSYPNGHPNVVAAYSALQLGDLLVFAMEYVEGENLAGLIEKNGPLPVARACYYVYQAALGLQHAHKSRMVHRDIKPGNLILRREGKNHVVKVLDFGLAKATSEKAAGPDLTGAQPLGTPAYMAPEQWLDASKADIRADIYSLGCTLYHLLIGGPPFTSASYIELWECHRTAEVPPLEVARPEVPAELTAVVRKMMAKDAGARYQTPAEVAEAMLPFVKPGTQAPSSNPPGAAPVKHTAAQRRRSTAAWEPGPKAPTAKPATWNKWLLGAGVAAGALLLALVALWASGVLPGKPADGSRVEAPKPGPDGDGERPAAPPVHAPDPPTPAVADGFVPLLTGNELTPDWLALQVGGGVGWSVTDGILTGRSTGAPTSGGELRTWRTDYADFHFRCETMLGEKVAWIRLRGRPAKGDWASVRGYALRIAGTDTLGTDPPEARTGSLWEGLVDCPPTLVGKAANVPLFLKPGQWFGVEILAHGPRLESWVAGQKIAECVLPDPEFATGSIDLVCPPGTTVRFRNLAIKELPRPAAPAPAPAAVQLVFFNGKDLAGWEGLRGFWSVRDGAIVGAPPPNQRPITYLCSTQAYRDFELRFNVRLKNGAGNSGLQFRSRLVDAKRFVVHGPMVEILSLTPPTWPAPGSIGTLPNGRHLFAYRERIARVWRNKDFNAMTLRCVGSHVTVTVNGTAAVDDDYPGLPEEGIFGWELWGKDAPEEITIKDIGFTDLSPPAPPPSAEHFVPLFRGQGLTGWRVVGARRTEVKMEDGAVVAHNRGAASTGSELLTTTRHDLGDFHLRYEGLFNDKGVGPVVGIRVDASEKPFGGLREYAVSFGNDARSSDGVTTLWLACRGRGRLELARQTHAGFTPGTWHSLEVLAQGNRIRVRVDGKERIDYFDPGQAFRRGGIQFGVPPQTTIRLRNVQIAELPTAPTPAHEDPRTRWEWTQQADPANELWGVFQQLSRGEWVETFTRGGPGQPAQFWRYSWREVQRTPDYVELERRFNNGILRTRLHATGRDMSWPNEPFRREGGSGGWEKEG